MFEKLDHLRAIVYLLTMKKFTKKDLEKEDGSKAEEKEAAKKAPVKSGYEVIGLFMLLLGIVIFVSLYSYAPSDVHILEENALGYTQQNAVGIVGASLAYLLVYFFGIGSYFCGILSILLGFSYLIKITKSGFRRFIGTLLFVICFIWFASAWELNIRAIYGGGFCGDFLHFYGVLYLSAVGSGLVGGLLFLYALHLLFNISWFTFFEKTATTTKKAGGTIKKAGGTIKEANNKRKEKKNSALAIEDKNSIPFEIATADYTESDNKGETIPNLPLITKQKQGIKEKILALFNKKKESSKEESDEDKAFSIESGEILDLTAEHALENLESEQNQDNIDDIADSEYANNADENSLTKAEEEFLNNEAKNDTASKAKEDTKSKLKRNLSDWSIFPKKKQGEKTVEKKEEKAVIELTLPPISLLTKEKQKEIKFSQVALIEKGEKLIKALETFKVQAKLVRAIPGPVITMYEIKPAAGIRVSKISALSDDLAMNLSSVSIRIQAPIPGSDSVGIEVPNDERANVSFRELIEGSTFQDSDSLLTMALGKDIKGTPFSANLATMPHLLIAGATGAGKSVCLNSIIISLLYKAKPDEVKLLLVDPKRIELSVYSDLPHLVHPVVTDMELAKNALQWAIEEMNKRFELLRILGVRKISDYNEKVKNMAKPMPLPDEMQPNKEETKYHSHVPYLVIIIDELADLIMTHGKEVEGSIVRLAQLARAAGIHLILATQRPSVNVVTGLIKANFPCRISFQVTQSIDSRTILDAKGAETLLGRGDMLFKPGGGKLLRLHGAFVPDEDVVKVIDYWKKQQKPEYNLDFTVYTQNKQEGAFEGGSRSGIAADPKYQEAIEILPLLENVSISALQRKLSVGFNKAANIKEQLEKDGYIQDR